MKDPDSPWTGIDRRDLHQISDRAQADILTDPVRSRYLFPFLGRDLSVTQAATELGCSTNTMLYRVGRMLAAGLLRVTDVHPRAGRPIRIYRSSHDGYFVPNQAMHYDDLRHRVARQEDRLSERVVDAYSGLLLRSGNSGRALARDADGHVWSTDLPPTQDDRGSPAYTIDVEVELTIDEARTIRDLLVQATRRAIDPPRRSPGARRGGYLIRALILPSPT